MSLSSKIASLPGTTTRKLAWACIVAFAILVVVGLWTGLHHILSPTQPSPQRSAIPTETCHAITYAQVRYVNDGTAPYVEVVDENGNVYTDHGSSTSSARYQFLHFYQAAFNKSGILTEYEDPAVGKHEINSACWDCDHLDPEPNPE